MESETDFEIQHFGSMVGFFANTDAALDEMETMGLAPWQKLGARLFYVDSRLAGNLIDALLDNGLTIS